MIIVVVIVMIVKMIGQYAHLPHDREAGVPGGRARRLRLPRGDAHGQDEAQGPAAVSI